MRKKLLEIFSPVSISPFYIIAFAYIFVYISLELVDGRSLIIGASLISDFHFHPISYLMYSNSKRNLQRPNRMLFCSHCKQRFFTNLWGNLHIKLLKRFLFGLVVCIKVFPVRIPKSQDTQVSRGTFFLLNISAQFRFWGFSSNTYILGYLW